MMTMNKRTNAYFQSLRREKGLTLQAVASAARFSSITDVYLFEIGAIVDNETQQKIVNAFSQLTGQSYTLSNIASSMLEEQPTVVIQALSRSQGKGV
jgi:hypothetical protein